MIVSGQALLEGLLRVAPQGKHRQAKKNQALQPPPPCCTCARKKTQSYYNITCSYIRALS